MIRLVRSWITRNLQVFFSSLGELSRSPVGTAMTAAVLGIALALPTGLYLLLDNAQTLGQGWNTNARLSLFLKDGVSNQAASELQRHIASQPGVASADLITAEMALQEYKETSGFGAALEALTENPLPAVIIVDPTVEHSQPHRLRVLVESLSNIPDVEIAQFDLQWVHRLNAILGVIQQGVVILAALLAAAVLLIIGNTIRLAINNQREEIEIIRLFGATDAFIRRPFLYTGLWYGLLGSLLAWIMVSIAFSLLDSSMQALTDLYQSDFLLHGLSPLAVITLFISGAALGLGGSWLAVGRHLKDIQPS